MLFASTVSPICTLAPANPRIDSLRKCRCSLLSAYRLSTCSFLFLYNSFASSACIRSRCRCTSGSYSLRTTIRPALAFFVHSFCRGQFWQCSLGQRYCWCFSSTSPRCFVCVRRYFSSCPSGQRYVCFCTSQIKALFGIFLFAFLSLVQSFSCQGAINSTCSPSISRRVAPLA